MNTLNFPDANVWLALLWDRHAHSEAARAWFDRCEEEKFFFCRITQLTVLRLLTTEQIMGTAVQNMVESWRLWDKIAADDRIEFLHEPDGLEPGLRRQSRLPSASPKVWADAYLMAFASAAGLKLITFDRALKSRTSDILILPE
jgi:uncharacterized protein